MSRLEEIKKQRQKKSTALDYIDLDIDWIINRVEELEEELEKREIDQINKHYENKNLINRLKEENKRYKQALEEITKLGWSNTFGGGYSYMGEYHAKSIKIANKALKGESDD